MTNRKSIITPVTSLQFRPYILLSLLFASIQFSYGKSVTDPMYQKLDAFLAQPEREIDIAEGALLVSKLEHPELNIKTTLASVDQLADLLETQLRKAGSAKQRLKVLSTFLFVTHKFNTPKQDDAAAFLLSDVLKRKRGNCLGLSLVCLSLAERAGLKLYGVPVPSRLSGAGHLLVRYDDGKFKINFDPSHGGTTQSNAYYKKEFKLSNADMKNGYILGNATKKEVLNILMVNLGGEWILTGKPAPAVSILERAVKINTRYAPAFNNLGAAYLALRKLSEAEKAYQRALKLDPKILGAHLGLGELAIRKGDSKAAEKFAQFVLGAEPKNLEAKGLMANVHLARNEFRAAQAALRAIVRARPKDISAHCNLGIALRMGGAFDEAEQTFRNALALDAKHAKALYGLGETLKATGRKKEADQAFAKALKADPNHGEVNVVKAREAQQARRYPDAEKAFRNILKNHPKNFEALAGLSEVLIAQRKFKEAIKTLKSAFLSHPKNPHFLLLQGEAFMGIGDYRSALTQLSAAKVNAQPSARIPLLQRIGVCYGRLRNHRKAWETAELLLKDNPKDTVALEIAAVACEGFRNRSKAIQYYKRIVKINPKHTKALKALKRLGSR